MRRRLILRYGSTRDVVSGDFFEDFIEQRFSVEQTKVFSYFFHVQCSPVSVDGNLIVTGNVIATRREIEPGSFEYDEPSRRFASYPNKDGEQKWT